MDSEEITHYLMIRGGQEGVLVVPDISVQIIAVGGIFFVLKIFLFIFNKQF